MPPDVLMQGGATIPTRRRIPIIFFKRIGASWPIAELTADYKGIDVSLSSRRSMWHVSWAELDHVLVGPRSMVFFPAQGRPCRFKVRSRRTLEPLMRLLNSRHIRTQQVDSTISWVFRV
jgi:hypothetical protein